MYFFLDNLSLLDITCTIVPLLLANLLGPDKSITSSRCITQVFVFCWIIASECALLAVMAIDGYVAVCQPLYYTLIMHACVCVKMAAVFWSSGLMNLLLQTTLTLKLPPCANNTLDHFFCEVPHLIKLACGDTTANELAISLMTIPYKMMSSLLLVIFYTFIAGAILKPPSVEGREKVFNTCSSHLLAVIMYFGPGI
ncbi:olfactory receptor 15-like [Heterocephalus glaber]|uniref:Olfactory receptor 15-like n=1 Tax=Heterocephalus glaber TaxID=10181 RepID=A0AAX6QUD8_HETGA|nr:olfactory receptor 15-like [Heterocephalus glaber]